MKQRVAIARALANEPRILIMDEPFGALDAQTRCQMQSYLLQIWKKVDVTILFITHDLEEAAYLSDRIVVLGANPGARASRSSKIPCRARAAPAQFLSARISRAEARLEELIHPPDRGGGRAAADGETHRRWRRGGMSFFRESNLSESALLLIDFQRDFCASGGYADRCGGLDWVQPILPNAGRLLAAARAAGLTIIHTREGYAPDFPIALRRSSRARAAPARRSVRAGRSGGS